MSKRFFRNTIAILAVVTFWMGFLCFVSGCGQMSQSDTAEFAVETLAMAIGYELRNEFRWTDTTQAYYTAIMDGKMDLGAAQAAEGYLRTVTHPLIANRLVRLAGMVGFSLDDTGKLIGVDKVNISLLKVAAAGFRAGLTLQ